MIRRYVLGIGGRVGFWIGWPALYLYMLSSERTRVIISCGENVLVVKGWLSDGRWNLPGGGMHKGEQPMQALLREVYEETKLRLTGDKVTFIRLCHRTRGFHYDFHLFRTELIDMPVPLCEPYEIADAQWLPWRQLLDGNKLTPDTREALMVWAADRQLG